MLRQSGWPQGHRDMSLVVDDLAATIRATKRDLRAKLPALRQVFAQVEDETRREAESVGDLRERGRPVIPCVEFREILAGTVPSQTLQEIRRRGAAVVRGVFPAAQ